MNDRERKKYEQELIEDANRLMEEIEKDPKIRDMKAPSHAREMLFKAIREQEEKEADFLIEKVRNDPVLKDVEAPADAYDNIMRAIHKKEAEDEIETLCDENKELIRLGKIYKRKRKNRKYFVLAATIVLVLAFGITSMGGPEKIFEKLKIITLEREQNHLNSDEDVVLFDEFSEDKVYQEIEEEYGFYPVKLDSLPEGIEFQEATIGNEIQGISLIYGHENIADIILVIRPNYRTGSFGTDMEDKKIQEYQMKVKDTEILIKQYEIEENGESRWSAEFEFKDTQYCIRFLRMEKEEVERILQNLYFPKDI